MNVRTSGPVRLLPWLVLPLLLLATARTAGASGPNGDAGGYLAVRTEVSSGFAYVVLHALDRDGYCDAAAYNAVSLHPVLTDAPNDTIVNGSTRRPNPRFTVDFLIDSGEGIIVGTSAGSSSIGGRAAIGVPTFSTQRNAALGSLVRAFDPVVDGVTDECQAWVRIANSTAGVANVLVIVHDDLGDIGFDRVIDFSKTAAAPESAAAERLSELTAMRPVSLALGWNLVPWDGGEISAAGFAAEAAMPAGARVGAISGWDRVAGSWRSFYPGSGAPAAGASDLDRLVGGQAYWVFVTG